MCGYTRIYIVPKRTYYGIYLKSYYFFEKLSKSFNRHVIRMIIHEYNDNINNIIVCDFATVNNFSWTSPATGSTGDLRVPPRTFINIMRV